MPQQPLSTDTLASEAPGLIMFLPLVYVAWADGILTPTEISNIRDQLGDQDWISDEDGQTLADWLNPVDPPSATTYHRWLSTLQAFREHIPVVTRRSLIDTGLEMARLQGIATPSEEAIRALHDLEAALGLVGSEAYQDLIAERPAPPDEEECPTCFDVEALTALLDEPHADLRERIRTLLSDPAFRYVSDKDTNAYRDHVLHWLGLLADQGLGLLAYPEEVGGEDDMARFVTAFETLAFHDMSLVIKFGVQFGLFGGSVHQLGTERHHKTYLADIGTLKLPGCFAMSELGHGSNVRELQTVARYDRETEEFIINTPSDFARKEWIGNAARHGRMATVFAQLEMDDQSYGVHAFLVPIRRADGTPQPRVRIEDCGEKLGLNGIDNGRIWFDKVRIPRENLLNRFADVHPDGTYESPIHSSGRRFFAMLSTLVGGRISIGLGALSAAKSGLCIAIRYGNRRRQFGPRDQPEVQLMDYLTHQRRLLIPLSTVYAIDFAFKDLTLKFAYGEPDVAAEVEVQASGLKAYSTWHTMKTLQACRESCGGQGYLKHNRFAALKADLDVFTTFEGDNTVLMLQVAKGLLSEFKQEFKEMSFFGMVNYLARGARTTLLELNPVVTRRTDEGHLLDPEFHYGSFVYRERRLLQTVARRLKRRIDDGMNSFDAFIACQDHLVTLSEAHIERIILDRFRARIDSCSDDSLQNVLNLLFNLFALSRIEHHRGWYLENGYLEGNKAKAIRTQVNALCKTIRPMSLDLVNAFNIPDALLSAPIAT